MIKKIGLFCAAIVSIILMLILIAFVYLEFSPVFGGQPNENSQEKIAQSANFNGTIFQNKIATQISTRTESSPSTFSFLVKFIFGPNEKTPQSPLKNQPFSKNALREGDITWLGHSTVLFSTNNLTVITDPVFYRVSPIPVGGEPFPLKNPITPQQLPTIDVVLISHDHYDHLDMQTIKEIKHKVKQFIVPLGVKAHLLRWGVNTEKITELDWYEEKSVNNTLFTLAPARHFSGRALFDQMKTLWGSWVVSSPQLNLYFSGDGGYSPEFKKIGSQYGPFDIAIMENGAYDENWSQIHMYPEETIRASQDLQANFVLPIHWGKYDLANHHWVEPIQRLSAAAEKSHVTLITPMIGQRFQLKSQTWPTWWHE